MSVKDMHSLYTRPRSPTSYASQLLCVPAVADRYGVNVVGDQLLDDRAACGKVKGVQSENDETTRVDDSSIHGCKVKWQSLV